VRILIETPKKERERKKEREGRKIPTSKKRIAHLFIFSLSPFFSLLFFLSFPQVQDFPELSRGAAAHLPAPEGQA
jgi:hypothetical protein